MCAIVSQCVCESQFVSVSYVLTGGVVVCVTVRVCQCVRVWEKGWGGGRTRVCVYLSVCVRGSSQARLDRCDKGALVRAARGWQRLRRASKVIKCPRVV